MNHSLTAFNGSAFGTGIAVASLKTYTALRTHANNTNLIKE